MLLDNNLVCSVSISIRLFWNVPNCISFGRR